MLSDNQVRIFNILLMADSSTIKLGTQNYTERFLYEYIKSCKVMRRDYNITQRDVIMERQIEEEGMCT